MTDILHIASVSGGKDSVAMCLYLQEQGIEHTRVFMDTGWEHPTLYAHLDYLETVLGPIERIRPRIPDLPADLMPEVEAIEELVGVSPSAFVRWIVKKGMFPSRVRRFCTQELKVRPFLRWVDALDADIVNTVGIRAEESAARARLPAREFMPGAEHIEVWRPLLHWTEAQVIEIHQRHDVLPCPLYLSGSTRVGCWPCIQSNKRELAQLRDDDSRLQAIRLLEDLVGRLATDRAHKRGETLDNLPAMYQSQRAGIDGRRRCIPIDSVMEWASTEYGGRQLSIDVSWGRESGCVRWGMCEGLTG